MKFIREGKMKDGTLIYLEDWSVDYPKQYTKNNVITAYPIADRSSGGPFGVRGGETFSIMFIFENEEQAMAAFNKLLTATKGELKSLEAFSFDRKRLNCI